MHIYMQKKINELLQNCKVNCHLLMIDHSLVFGFGLLFVVHVYVCFVHHITTVLMFGADKS